MNKLAFGVGGAALALLVAIPLLTKNKSVVAPSGETMWQTDVEITQVSNEAFGVLSDSAQVEQATGLGSARMVDNVAEVAPMATNSVPAGFGGGGFVDTKIALPPVQYNYVYVGDELVLPEDNLAVLRKVKNSSVGVNLARQLSSNDFGVVDLKSFSNQQVNNISFLEDKPYGYMIHVNLVDGDISINQNWQEWPNVDYNQRLTINDVPSDADLIAIADAFLQQHGISTVGYGQPVVSDEWRVMYEQSTDKANYYIPDTAQVIYPLTINGQTVFDQGGTETGIMVNVNLRFDRVTNVYGLTSQQYESSNYRALNDSQRILKMVSQGGIYPNWYRDENVEVRDLEVGTPRQILTRFYKYDEEHGTNQELLAPALLFPVMNTPSEDYWYQRSIVIPLVEDLIPEQTVSPEPLPVEIMQMAR